MSSPKQKMEFHKLDSAEYLQETKDNFFPGKARRDTDLKSIDEYDQEV